MSLTFFEIISSSKDIILKIKKKKKVIDNIIYTVNPFYNPEIVYLKGLL